MKNIKNFAVGLIVTCMVAICPILCIACGENQNNYGKNISKALDSSISVLKENITPNSISGKSLEFETVENNVAENLFVLDYIKAITSSSKFEYTTSPFKGTATISQGDASMTISSSNRFSISDNKVSVEMYFAVQGSPSVDYEWMQIDYDFEKEQLNSFDWYGYVTTGQQDDTFYYYKYQNETLSRAVEGDDEYTSLKDTIKSRGLALAQSEDFIQKVYDFTKEYIDVYNLYNPESQIH